MRIWVNFDKKTALGGNKGKNLGGGRKGEGGGRKGGGRREKRYPFPPPLITFDAES